MKKIVDFIFRSSLILIILFGYIVTPIPVDAAKNDNQTLGDLKKELKEYQAKKKANQNKQEKTKEEMAQAQNNMGNTNKEIKNAEEQIAILTDQIEKTNKEIDVLKEETAELILLYQKLENENIYLSYITGASSMTELIMRMDAINQFTEHNQEKMDNLELLIRNNEKMSKQLESYQVKLNEKLVEYQNIFDDLGDDLAKLVEGVPTLDDQIQDLKKSIKAYEDAGCKDNDLIVKCMNIQNNTGWLRPIKKGKITSAFGYRLHPVWGDWRFHNGIDISASDGTKAYAPANGVVGAVVTLKEWDKYKSSLKNGGQKIYLNVYVNNVKYTVIYMHMLEVYVEVGDVVTTDTVVGLTGGGKTSSKRGGYDNATTGAHLHYGVAKGVHYNGSGNLSAYYINPPGFPAKGSWFYSR